ncbi:hypothetical protein [Chrysiogenes arsenatis]|uniref:hypothetical protein n=1 Tax=Chrysiogenes arsenatis TaxID=309797 RepID=UPI00040CCF0E|nr:hypothetical protein [Chrysiogenes arsenatis]
MAKDNFGMLRENVVTDNIALTLKQIADEQSLPVEQMDFTLSHTSTPFRDGERFIRHYTIDVFTKGFSPIELRFTLRLMGIELMMRIERETKVDTALVSPVEILAAIHRELALAGIVYGLFDDDILYTVAAKIFQASATRKPFDDALFPIARGQVAHKSDTPLAEPEYHFDQYDILQGEKRSIVDVLENSQDTFITRSGDLLITVPEIPVRFLHISPYGEITRPHNTQPLFFRKVSPSIRTEKTEASARYYALCDGYLALRDQTLTIVEQLTLRSGVSLGETGDITATDSDIRIEAPDGQHDAVAAGRIVEGKNIVINGHVGARAIIRGENVTINGVLHKDATVEAVNNATIKISKGTVKADNATIHMLEAGLVECTAMVEVTGKSMQSVIRSPQIFINEMVNSSVTTGGYQVIITNVSDGSNFIIIDPLIIDSVKERYEAALSKKATLIKGIQNTKKNYINKQSQIADLEKQQGGMVAKIEEMRKASHRIPAVFSNIIDRYDRLNEERKHYKKQLLEMLKLLNKLDDLIYRVQHVETMTSITVKRNLPKGNVLKFGKNSSHTVIDQDRKAVIIVKTRDKGIEFLPYTEG